MIDRVRGLRVLLMATTEFHQYAHLLEEAAIELERQSGPEGDGWTSVEKQKPPMGNCLVYLAGDLLKKRIHSATYHPNIVTIGGVFSFDAPKVTHWRPMPDAPSHATDGSA